MLRQSFDRVSHIMRESGKTFCKPHSELARALESSDRPDWCTTGAFVKANDYSRDILATCLQSFGRPDKVDCWTVASQIVVSRGLFGPAERCSIAAIAAAEPDFFSSIRRAERLFAASPRPERPAANSRFFISAVGMWVAIRACRRVTLREPVYSSSALALLDFLRVVGAETEAVGRPAGGDEASRLLIPSMVHSLGMAVHYSTAHIEAYAEDPSRTPSCPN